MRDLRELNLNDYGDPVTRDAPDVRVLSEIESKLGHRLPQEYIEFLQFSNGGQPELNCLTLHDGTGTSMWTIDEFYHVSGGTDDDCDMASVFDDYRQFLEKDCLPIACDEGGNQYVLDFSTSPPSIKISIHDESFRLIPVASSFEQFIDLLDEGTDMI